MLYENVQKIKEVLVRESVGWDRVPTLIAVTKYVDADAILPLREAGITDIGENRVQALREKLPQISGKFNIHLIGQLQTNKVKYIIKDVVMIHSLDNLHLAEEISRRASDAEKRMDVLIEVNIANEPQKGGVPEEEALPFLRKTAGLPGLRVSGFMAMMPIDADESFLEEHFKRMRVLFDHAREIAYPGTDIRELSMGMSRDYAIAARNGATMVRVGTALWQS